MYEPSTIENGQIKATVKSFSLYGVFEATKLVPPTTYKEQGIVSKGETIELAHTQGAEIYYGADLLFGQKVSAFTKSLSQ